LRAFAAPAGLIFCLALSVFWSAGSAAALDRHAKTKIAFAGDSLVDNYWAGVTRLVAQNPCLQDNLELGRFTRNGTGLSRGDRVYWPREMARIDNTYRPALTVISIGMNDRQYIVDAAGARTGWGSPDWNEKYSHELTEFLKNASAHNAIVLLIGLPVMRDTVSNEDATEKNRIFAEAVAKLGRPNLHYVEPWKLNASSPDTFASHAPDKSGKLVQIRQSDGLHFAAGGEDLLALYLLPKIIAALDQAGIPVNRCPSTRQTNAAH
jgi:hypothetical protein